MIDAFIAILVLFAALDIWAVMTLNFGTILPYHLIWLREAVRIGLAIVLFVMRPKGRRALS